MKRKLLSLALALCLVLSLLPVGALAEESYKVWVGGVQVTSNKLSDEDGHWSYDPDSKTLTLNNYSYDESGYRVDPDVWSYCRAGIYAEEDLTIVLEGENRITMADPGAGNSGDYESAAVFVQGGDLTITSEGGGTLTASGYSFPAAAENTPVGESCSYGIVVYEVYENNQGVGGSLTFDSAKVTASGGNANDDSCGIYVYNDLIVTNQSDLTVTTGDAGDDIYGAIYVSEGDLTIVDSTVTVTTGDADDDNYGAIYVDDGDLTVDNSTVSVETGNAGCCDHGIYVEEGSFYVDHSQIEVYDGNCDDDIGADIYGIYVNDNFTVDGGSTVSVITGNTDDDDINGIYVRDNFTVDGGSTVTVKTGSAEGNSNYGVYVSEQLAVEGGSSLEITNDESAGGYYYGFYGYGLTVDDASTVTVSAGTAAEEETTTEEENTDEEDNTAYNSCYGIYAYYYAPFLVNGGSTVSVSLGDCTSSVYGVYVYETDLTVSDNSELTVETGDAGEDNYGIYQYEYYNSYTNITVGDNSKLTVETGDAGEDNIGVCRYYTYGELNVSENSELTVETGDAGEDNCALDLKYSTLVIKDKSTVTLTVGNAGEDDEDYESDIYAAYVYPYQGDSVVSGDSALSVQTGDAVNDIWGIYIDSGDIIVERGGSITVNTGDAGGDNYGLYQEEERIVVKNGGAVTVETGDAGEDNYGVAAEEGFDIRGGSTVTATTGDAGETNYGLWVECGDFTVAGDSTVTTGTGNAVHNNYGVILNDGQTNYQCSIDKGSTITTTTGESQGDNYGVFAEGSFTVNDGATVIANPGTSAANNFGIYIDYGSASIKGDVHAAAGEAGEGYQSVGFVLKDYATLDVTGALKAQGHTIAAASGEYGASPLTITANIIRAGSKYDGSDAEEVEKTGQKATLTVDAAENVYLFVFTNGYSVTYDPNGGTGTIEGEDNVFDSITLPECTFTAPEGSRFKTWRINGEDHQPGESFLPESSVVVTAIWECTVSFDANGGTPVPESQVVERNDFADEPAAPAKTDCTFDGWYWDSSFADGTKVDFANYPIVSDVTFYAKWIEKETTVIYVGGGGGGSTTYLVKVSAADGGTVTAKPTRAAGGELVTLTVTPDEGYQLDKLTVTDDSGNTVGTTDNGNGTYSFFMPVGGANVSAAFLKGKTESKTGKFEDVPEGAYYHDAVYWAVDKGVTTGADDTHFAPDDPCTRAQAVTFLWRAAGEPEPAAASTSFVDVSPQAYYYKAVLWAVEKGITTGTDATHFSPNAIVTRGQMVTFLWRFEGQPQTAASGCPFVDVKETDYFYYAVLWAAETGVTSGTTPTTFAPGEDCLRCQVITFLYRVMEGK